MFKNMNLGFKIGAGFAAILLISVFLGGFCVFSMKNAQHQSNKMAFEYVPEVDMANEVERHSFEVMYAMRGYGLSEEEQYLKTAKENIVELNEHLKEAKAHSEKYSGLVKLKENVSVAQAKVDEYIKLIAETEEANHAIAEARKNLDASAIVYMNGCNNYLEGQQSSLQSDVAKGLKGNAIIERVGKINEINDVINLGNSIRIVNFKSQAMRDPKIIEDNMKIFDQIDAKVNQIRSKTNQSINIQRLDNIKKGADSYKENLTALLNNWIKLQDLNTKRTDVGNKVLEAAQKTSMAGMDQTKSTASVAAIAMAASSTLMIIGLIIAIVVGSALAYIIVIGITKPVNRIVNGLNESSQQVSSASAQLSASSQQLAEGSAEQASSIEETSSTLEESASMVRQNTENTKQAAQLAKQAKDAANKGNIDMQQMMKSMEDLKKSSDEIAKIIKVIDEIAFQTNILALNAAVEAARAGEAGQGFAVVAEEVRNLAQRSAQAAKDTASIIESNIHLSEEGVTVSKHVNQSLGDINSQAQKVSELLDEVAAASQEQAQGIAQINKAISQMEQVVQSNASTAEESASASEELNAQSENMKEIVNSLVALVNGANAIHQQAYASIASHTEAKKVLPNVNRRISSNTVKSRQDTKIVSPEDVIPLEDNNSGF